MTHFRAQEKVVVGEVTLRFVEAWHAKARRTLGGKIFLIFSGIDASGIRLFLCRIVNHGRSMAI